MVEDRKAMAQVLLGTKTPLGLPKLVGGLIGAALIGAALIGYYVLPSPDRLW